MRGLVVVLSLLALSSCATTRVARGPRSCRVSTTIMWSERAAWIVEGRVYLEGLFGDQHFANVSGSRIERVTLFGPQQAAHVEDERLVIHNFLVPVRSDPIADGFVRIPGLFGVLGNRDYRYSESCSAAEAAAGVYALWQEQEDEEARRRSSAATR
jgi:hypothetical protein